MTRRPGVTLIEVLVAIFVAAIGTLSLLVLFPLGALNMARAIRDDRCAQAGLNAAALANALAYRTDTNVETPPGGGSGLNANAAVYVDAIGATVLGGSSAGVGGLGGTAPTTSITRVSPTAVTGATSPTITAYKLFRLPDDIAFNSAGLADTSAGAYVDRGGRYTWAYMRRPPSTLNPGAADVSVVVYDGRNTGVAGGESFFNPIAPPSPLTGTTWPIGSTSITISYSGTPPSLRRGNWILDASKSDNTSRTTNVAPDAPEIGSIHSFFYRVVDVTDTGTTLILDLESPLVAAINGPGVTSPSVVGIIVILDNVAQVYERRTGWKP